MQSPKDFDLSRRNLLIGAAASAAVIAPAATAKAQSATVGTPRPEPGLWLRGRIGYC